MSNDDYIKANMLALSQNDLLMTQLDYENYELLCQFILKCGRHFSEILGAKEISYRKTISISDYQFRVSAREKLIPWIFSKTQALDDLDFKIKMSTRVFWITHAMKDFPICKLETCHAKILKNVISYWIGFTKHCCVQCINRDVKVRNKIARTKTELYGDPTFNNRPKNNSTCKAKYGVLNGGGSHIAHAKMHRKYFYANKFFDSAPEIAYFMWLIDNNIVFEYQPKQPFKYKFNGKTYNYFADFKIDNKYIEIKGNHFFNKDGILFCPYRKKTWTDEQYAIVNARYAAKYQCMLDNNVVILKTADYKVFIDYVEAKYGKNYLKRFRVNKPKDV